MQDARTYLRHNFLVCICTRNREDSLVRLLTSIQNNNYKELSVLIVDSTFPEERFLAFDPKAYISQGMNLQRVRTNKGLPSARNIAINYLENEDFVVYLDDDVTLPSNFFSKINEYFAEPNSTDALGVRVVDQYKIAKGPIKKLLAKSRSRTYGKITRSGHNIWLPDRNFGNVPVDWLPGCCMIYKRLVFSELRFNEKLENGPTGGYALGEDVDFSYACSRSFKIEATDSISIIHHFEKSTRDNQKAMVVADALFKAHLKNSYAHDFSDFRIILSHLMRNAWTHRNSAPWKMFSLSLAFLLNYLKERIRKSYLIKTMNEAG